MGGGAEGAAEGVAVGSLPHNLAEDAAGGADELGAADALASTVGWGGGAAGVFGGGLVGAGAAASGDEGAAPTLPGRVEDGARSTLSTLAIVTKYHSSELSG